MTDTVIIVVPTNARILERRAVLTLRHVNADIPSVLILTSIEQIVSPNFRSWARHKSSVYRNETFWNYVINDVYVLNSKRTDGWGLPAR